MHSVLVLRQFLLPLWHRFRNGQLFGTGGSLVRPGGAGGASRRPTPPFLTAADNTAAEALPFLTTLTVPAAADAFSGEAAAGRAFISASSPSPTQIGGGLSNCSTVARRIGRTVPVFVFFWLIASKSIS